MGWYKKSYVKALEDENRFLKMSLEASYRSGSMTYNFYERARKEITVLNKVLKRRKEQIKRLREKLRDKDI